MVSGSCFPMVRDALLEANLNLQHEPVSRTEQDDYVLERATLYNRLKWIAMAAFVDGMGVGVGEKDW